MAYSNIPFFTQKTHTAGAVLSAASLWTPSNTVNTNLVTLFTAGANGSRITSLFLATTDSAANDVYIVLDVGGAGTNFVIIAQVHVPITSGTAASVPCVDALALAGFPIDNNGKNIIQLAASDKVWIGVVANMTAAKVLFATAQGEDY